MATTDKYDRQLRLWGASGQRALGNTLVVLIGSSACGTETLKNLVLPGVGSILVVDDDGDDDVVDVADSNAAGAANGNSGIKVEASPELSDALLKFASPSANFFLPTSTSSFLAHDDDHDDDGNDNSKPKKLSNAAKACALLSELNPDVHGYHYTVPSLEGLDYISFLRTLMDNPPSSSSSSTKILVIAADQPSSSILPLSHACHIHSIPLLSVRSYGLLGTVRIQTASPYHCIVESKPAHRIPDLRLSTWPLFDGLQKVVKGVSDLDTMEDTKDHSHVPFVVILLQALDKWRNEAAAATGASSDSANGDTNDTANKPRYPATFDEKTDFRMVVKGMAKNLNNEVNFEEAIREAHLVWADGRISDDVKLVLDRVDEETFFGAAIQSDMEVDGCSSKVPTHVLQFQLLSLALKRFLKQNDDYPPLEGTIPDMTSDTTRYVALQEAYQQQAEKDRSTMTSLIQALLEECKQKSNGCDLRVTMPSDDEITTFCKNARYLRILETRPLFAEYKLQDPASPVISSLSNTLTSSSTDMNNFDSIQSDARDDLLMATMDPYETDPVQTPLLWWIALRACDAFYDRHQHYPGKHDQELALEADANEVYKCMVQIVTSLGLSENSDFIKEHLLDITKGKDLAREVVRYDEAEIHNIAAVVGGVASQEAVKLITGQYVPFDDTYVYNGIASTAGVYRF